jgi:hypothetical protein
MLGDARPGVERDGRPDVLDVALRCFDDTARHLIFGPEFLDASTRGLRNRIVRDWERRDDPPTYKVVPDSECPASAPLRQNERLEERRISGSS